MELAERLVSYREEKKLSQSDVAKKIKTTKQTLVKWETGKSVPNLNKIISLCELYEISIDELITGKKTENNNVSEPKKKKVKGICIGIIIYIIAIIWLMCSITIMELNSIIATAIFLLIISLASYFIVYNCIIYRKENKNENEAKDLLGRIDNIGSIITLIIYLIASFLTMAWHITWIIWIGFELLLNLLKIIMYLKGKIHEK